MNKNLRRLGRMYQKRNEVEGKKKNDNIEEVLPTKNRRPPNKLDKFTTNKCSYAVPSQEDFGQRTETDDIFDKQSSSEQDRPISKIKKNNLTKSCFVTPRQEDFGQLTETDEASDMHESNLEIQYGFNPLEPLKPETINQLKELKKMLCHSAHKVDNSSQYDNKKTKSPAASERSMESQKWQKINDVDDIKDYISQDKVHVSDIPRIKIIAKKFTRYKKNNIELRKLEEKVVCVEYDVFAEGSEKPREQLRAFFCIKPTFGSEDTDENALTNQIPSVIKNTYNIASEDLTGFNEKEIEIIDKNIEENKTYLEDLKRILVRNQKLYARKNKTSLDLMSLYEMAKHGNPVLEDGFSGTNFLSKSELQEMKDLILKKCASSVQGISRRTLKKRDTEELPMSIVSPSILGELFREGSTLK